jgi:hypothetical protein
MKKITFYFPIELFYSLSFHQFSVIHAGHPPILFFPLADPCISLFHLNLLQDNIGLQALKPVNEQHYRHITEHLM